MRGSISEGRWLAVTITLTTLSAITISGMSIYLLTLHISSFFFFHTPTQLSLSLSHFQLSFPAFIVKRKFNALKSKIHDLESSLKSSSHNCASERQGRIRAQQVICLFLFPTSSCLFLSYYYYYSFLFLLNLLLIITLIHSFTRSC